MEIVGEKIMIIIGYGLIEIGLFLLIIVWFVVCFGEIGLLVVGFEMKFVLNGEKMEVCVKGVLIMFGYWCQVDKMVEVFDEEGYYFMQDVFCYYDLNDIMKGFFFDGCVMEDFKFDIGIWVNMVSVCGVIIWGLVLLVCDFVLIGFDLLYIGGLFFFDYDVCCCEFLELVSVEDMVVIVKYLVFVVCIQVGFNDFVCYLIGFLIMVVCVIILEMLFFLDVNEIIDKGLLNQCVVMVVWVVYCEVFYVLDILVYVLVVNCKG